MAFRGLKLTWVCIAILFISCSIILSFKFKNSTFLLFPKHFSFCFYVPANRCYSKKTSKKFCGTGNSSVINMLLPRYFGVSVGASRLRTISFNVIVFPFLFSCFRRLQTSSDNSSRNFIASVSYNHKHNRIHRILYRCPSLMMFKSWLPQVILCHHIGYSFRLTARVLLYAPSHRQDSTYHSLCYTSRGSLAGMRNSSMDSLMEWWVYIQPKENNYTGAQGWSTAIRDTSTFVKGTGHVAIW